MAEEKQLTLEELDKQIKAKEAELTNLKLEIKSKAKTLENLNQVANTKDDNVLISKLQTQEEELLLCDKQIHALQKNIEQLNATKIDPQVLKERDDKIVELETQLQKFTTQNKQLIEQLQDQKVDLTKKQQAWEEREKALLDEIEAMKKTISEENETNARLTQELEEATKKRDYYRQKKRAQKKGNKELEAKITELSKKKSFVQSEQAKDDGDYLEKPDQKETGKEKELQHELELQLQLVSDLSRANMKLNEECEEAVKKSQKAHDKNLELKKQIKELQEKIEQFESNKQEGKDTSPDEAANEDGEKEDKEADANAEGKKEQKIKFESSESSENLKEEMNKLRQIYKRAKEKTKNYKKLKTEFEEKYNEAQKTHELLASAQQDNARSIDELHKQLDSLKAISEEFREKLDKSKEKKKNYKQEQRKITELYKSIPKKYRTALPDEDQAEFLTLLKRKTTEEWEQEEDAYITQTKADKATIEQNNQEIASLKKRIVDLIQEHGNASRVAKEEIEKLNQILKQQEESEKQKDEAITEKDMIINELELNIVKLEELNKEMEQHVEDVDEKIELSNTQILEMQAQLHEKEQEIEKLQGTNEFLEQKLKQATSKLKVMSDTLNIKDEEIKKKEEFTTRLMEESDKLKKKLVAANNKIQYELKGQIEDAEKRAREKEVELKIVKDMVQSTKTMLGIKETELAKLRRKIVQLESRPVPSVDQLDRYSDIQSPNQGGPGFRAYNRSLETRGSRSGENLVGKPPIRPDYSQNDEEYDSYPGDAGNFEERQPYVQVKSGMLPSIERPSQLKDNSYYSHKFTPEIAESPHIKSAYISTSKINYQAPLREDLRPNVYQSDDLANRMLKKSVKGSKKLGNYAFDPNADLETKSQNSEVHLSPVKVAHKKKGDA